MDGRIVIYVIFGLMPSLTWLSYYLTKDSHPEPKKMIIKVFILGALSTVPVFLAQVALAYIVSAANLSSFLTAVLYWFVVISFTEEIFKYLVVKLEVINNAVMDEPLDIMLYMVISALGFAALENILYLFMPLDGLSLNAALNRTVTITIIRFVGATFLHTLCSALIGYFWALSFCKEKKGKKLLFLGIIMAVGLHGLYDFSIMTLEGRLKITVPMIILVLLALFIYYAFEHLKKIKSVCKIEKLNYQKVYEKQQA